MASFLRRALAPISVSQAPLIASCVEVIGFSQTNQWFSARSDIFEAQVQDDRWEALIQSGGSVDVWADPDFNGWSNALSSKCNMDANSPQVVLFTVSGSSRSVDAWVAAIEEALATVATKVPSADLIILQPVVGGPNDGLCPAGSEPVRASENHPDIDAAIDRVTADRPDVRKGASPVVGTCDHYIDEIGHLTGEGANFVAQQLGAFYADLLN